MYFHIFFWSKIENLLKKDRLDLLRCTFAALRLPGMCNQLADAGWHRELIEFKVEDLRENCFESNDMISANVIGGAARTVMSSFGIWKGIMTRKPLVLDLDLMDHTENKWKKEIYLSGTGQNVKKA